MMINGFDLIEACDKNDSIDLEHYEKHYKLILPPIFKAFAKNFKWKADLLEGTEFFYTPELELGELYFRCHTIEQHFRYTYEMEDGDIDDHKFILIAASRYGVYLGTKGKDADKIFMGTQSTRGSYKIVAENIFDFLRHITNNLQEYATSSEEYRDYMIALGSEDEDIDFQVHHWETNYKK